MRFGGDGGAVGGWGDGAWRLKVSVDDFLGNRD